MDKSVVSLTRHMQTLWVLRRDSLSLEIQDNIMLIDVNISLHANIMLFLFKGYLHFTELKKKNFRRFLFHECCKGPKRIFKG